MLGTSGLNQSYCASFPILRYFATNPLVTRLNAVLDKYEPGLRQDTNNYSVVAVQSWTAGLAIGQATLGGWSPPLTFTPASRTPWTAGTRAGSKAASRP